MTKLKFDCLELAKELIPSLGITSKNELFALADDLYNYCSTGIESTPPKISTTHKLFSNYIEQPEALTNPAKYLGPNWEDVLNFWIYVEGLSKQEREELGQRYLALDYTVRDTARIAAREAADEVVGENFRYEAWRAAQYVTGWWVFGYATEELIAHHKLIEQNKTPLALQYCTKS